VLKGHPLYSLAVILILILALAGCGGGSSGGGGGTTTQYTLTIAVEGTGTVTPVSGSAYAAGTVVTLVPVAGPATPSITGPALTGRRW